MIHDMTGADIFGSPATVLICPVNCEGTMGKGLALEFARRFPGLEATYRRRCESSVIKVGVCGYWQSDDGPTVVLFPTKDRWRRPSEAWYVFAGLGSLARLLACSDWSGVAIPALGCGLGGLDWSRVRPMIEVFCGLFPARDFYVYGPGGGR